MNFLDKKIEGIKKRIKCYSFGMLYLRNSDFRIPSNLTINGRNKKLSFINNRDEGFVSEFTEICLNDCYHLSYFKKKYSGIKSIVDIGANQGIFLIAARQHFAHAKITGYEPNKRLANILTHNAKALNAEIYFDAVTKNDCKVNLQLTESDLATTTYLSEFGNVNGTAFKKVIDRAGGKIELLKMDCEGGEWDLLADTDSWKNIDALAMEYHLWAKQGSKREDIIQLVEDNNFSIINHMNMSTDQGLLIAINNSILKNRE